MGKAGRFESRSNAGTAKCEDCGKVRQKANIASFTTKTTGICIECHDRAGAENSVADGDMTPEEFHAEFGQHAWSCPAECFAADEAKALVSAVDEAIERLASKVCRGKWSQPGCQNAAVSDKWRICRECTKVRAAAKAAA